MSPTDKNDVCVEGDLGTIDRSELESAPATASEGPESTKPESAKPESKELSADEINKEQQQEINEAAEKLEEQVAQAYTKTSSWMGGLWSSISKQSSVILEEVGKDFEAVKFEVGELAKKRAEAKAAESSEEKSTEAAAGETTGETAEPVDSSRDLLSLLSTKAQLYIDNLDKDLEKVEDAGAAYFSKIGSNFQALMRETIRVEEGDSGDSTTDTLLFNAPEEVRQQVFSTRFDAQLHSLHTSDEVFLQPVDTGYESFKKDFDINSQTDQIAADLEAHPALRTLMEKLVPESIDYNSFWTRYYYMYQGIVAGEEQRKKVLSQAGGETEKEFDWDESDEETKTENTENDGSYDVVSRVASDVTLDKASTNKSEPNKAEPNKAESKQAKVEPKQAKEEESDDDWE
ncbi:hypothetical protein B0I72DRAFT_137864 [Yarrowia lipolytica]|uniref:YALI0F04554p n=2 Tax=Yarrowia lipolytica TaxID=4952 RepID=Q6C2W6_YARLI|nr:YALI0F04554p [Yarrowia lipolytica CLIB122]AOW06659.1 hypothetical protein YALI1_F06956g [Yarrowia lipolytica]KAB8284770.1 hypothetical protein BKA91DRAFT_134340 [Yarrowia lipolytica]KAE8174812.1 hypothetical protein BKA90DRAFT_133508 [Yarrowia lipolytica]KAJ8056119.1 hypothetical protein LXG23DRAFT_57649 [Yarrowia lipolytica]RDW27297.1 hypothetical protein B0I71DRAFT_129336 [Yarrowia lipolytica]|eukprot:XP_504996.1 YALI0F04554p [Yarrowia lipolytica CLIB122]